MYCYITLNEEQLISAALESSNQMPQERLEKESMVEIDNLESEPLGRYYVDGVIGPAPKQGHDWRLHPTTKKYVEVPWEDLSDTTLWPEVN